MKRILILVFLLMLLVLPFIAAHTDEFGEASNEMHFMHKGALTFPVWTYYAEIVEHLVIIIVAVAALYLVYESLNKKKKNLNFLIWGFVLIGVGELLTLLHHFLIYPLGIFNSVFNHGLLLAGIIFLSVGLIRLLRGE